VTKRTDEIPIRDEVKLLYVRNLNNKIKIEKLKIIDKKKREKDREKKEKKKVINTIIYY